MGCVYVPWAVCPHNTELECSCVFLQAGEEVRSAQKLMSQDFARVPFTLHREEGWTEVCDELAFFWVPPPVASLLCSWYPPSGAVVSVCEVLPPGFSWVLFFQGRGIRGWDTGFTEPWEVEESSGRDCAAMSTYCLPRVLRCSVVSDSATPGL